MYLVISSPSRSTMGWSTLILLKDLLPSAAGSVSVSLKPVYAGTVFYVTSLTAVEGHSDLRASPG